MRSRQTRHATFLAFTILALGAACEASLAATGADNGDAGPLTLTVQTPSGTTSRLTYADDDGWRLDDRDARLRPTEARITPASTEAQKDERPMTVFIDGPTGFTYVWMREQGWKFVGKLSERKR
ncbi:hypothetical protein BTHE68_53680 [Burkholderia sp. THE68]|uniref:hypothetical protein n=1 Tax=Burkholderia sp. THE68 TaxID=758782 RepID=UPI00131773C0|nr:hypothetical protein [Burkholderia sp. THE68]BBU31634.1 hypothetical protein BTHE68_53680 [Burkholderia sp. THE68]